MYDNGLDNDKLSLLYLENKTSKVAVKTHGGITDRVKIDEVVMQGTIWGNIKCTAQIDKLGKTAYERNAPLYYYKGEVKVPSLEMVDDIVNISTCSTNAVISNAVINSFIESKKLKFGAKKCNKMHIGKENTFCPDLEVHGQKMEMSEKSKYLGDILTNKGDNKANIEERKNKGYGIVAEILAILSYTIHYLQ